MDIWLKKLASIVYPIFSRPYSDENCYTSRIVNNKRIIIYRPNHGFLHSMRQALLTYNICHLLFPRYNFNHIKILMFLASFQRSGRESEISSENFPDLYHAYENSDIKFFKREAAKYKYLFSSNDEINDLSLALQWKSQSLISKIIRTAHILDLRRIPDFDMYRVKHDACICLFGKNRK